MSEISVTSERSAQESTGRRLKRTVDMNFTPTEIIAEADRQSELGEDAELDVKYVFTHFEGCATVATDLHISDRRMAKSYLLLMEKVPSLKIALESGDASALDTLLGNVSIFDEIFDAVRLLTTFESYRVALIKPEAMMQHY